MNGGRIIFEEVAKLFEIVDPVVDGEGRAGGEAGLKTVVDLPLISGGRKRIDGTRRLPHGWS